MMHVVQHDCSVHSCSVLKTRFLRIQENLENTGIWQFEFRALNILEFHQRSWKILEYEPIFGTYF